MVRFVYSTTDVRVNFFIDSKAKQGENVFYGRVSEPIKTEEINDKGKYIYEYETWNARFVGDALEKARTLADKTRITLKVWSARNPYNKEQGKSFPYLLISDFDLSEKGADNGTNNIG